MGKTFVETPQDSIVEQIMRWQMDTWRKTGRVRLNETHRQAIIDRQNDLRRKELRERQRQDLEQKAGVCRLRLRPDEDVALVMECVITKKRLGADGSSPCCKESFMAFVPGGVFEDKFRPANSAPYVGKLRF